MLPCFPLCNWFLYFIFFATLLLPKNLTSTWWLKIPVLLCSWFVGQKCRKGSLHRSPGVLSARVAGTRGSTSKMASWPPQCFLALFHPTSFILQRGHPFLGLVLVSVSEVYGGNLPSSYYRWGPVKRTSSRYRPVICPVYFQGNDAPCWGLMPRPSIG